MKAKDILFLLTLEPLVSSGRIGRLKYLLLSIWSWFSFAPLVVVDQLPFPWADAACDVFAALGLFYVFAAHLCLGIRRLHDMGFNGAMILITALWPLLVSWPGQDRENEYGPQPRSVIA